MAYEQFWWRRDFNESLFATEMLPARSTLSLRAPPLYAVPGSPGGWRIAEEAALANDEEVALRVTDATAGSADKKAVAAGSSRLFESCVDLLFN